MVTVNKIQYFYILSVKSSFFCRLNLLKELLRENILLLKLRVQVVVQLTALTVVQLPSSWKHYLYLDPVHLAVVAVVGPVKKKETVMMICRV
jgi:hypothetical protein